MARKGLFGWWHEGDAPAKKALIAASLGWMLDAFDVMLYALVLTSLMADLHLDSGTAGWIASVTLIAAAAGGLAFGVLADRLGRTRALMLSVLLYSIFTAACGFAQSAIQLAIFRIFLGIGMGGEWASGAALVSETWPDRVRGRALGFMQSSWAVGYALAAVVNYLVQDVAGLNWRYVFFVGVLPALITLWVRRNVEEPAIWRRARAESKPATIREAVAGKMLGITAAVTLMNAFSLFGWWAFNSWIPAYLRLPVASGGIGFSGSLMSGLVFVNQIGMWFGYITFGFISDATGRKRAYVVYLVLAAVSVWAYTSTANPWILLVLGPITSFFATGYFSGFGAVTAELYPTAVRATAQGFTYNLGRIASAAAPWLVGDFAKTHGYPAALSIAATAFLFAAMCWTFIPETKGRTITS
ncbi:MAG: MFS transporter [Acidobacteria bacterium]|nr:MAG: MFS transporter [Acidobacteriota bacterium]